MASWNEWRPPRPMPRCRCRLRRRCCCRRRCRYRYRCRRSHRRWWNRRAAAATATRCPLFPHTLSVYGLGFPSASDDGISAAVGRPTAGCPAALSAAPRPASRACVREHAGGTKPTLAIRCQLPAFALPSASRYSGRDGGVVDIVVYQATVGLYARRRG